MKISHKDNIVKPIPEYDAHRTMVVWIFSVTLVFSVIIGYVLLNYFNQSYEDNTNDMPTLIVILASGILGSFVSALNRIYSAKDIFPNKEYSAFLKNANLYLIIYSTIPALVGAISAVILYLVFAGDMISGSLFPKFHCSLGESKCMEFKDFLTSWKPEKPTDYAKAIIWGFIAGFSERFVPDILNNLTKNRENKKTIKKKIL